MLNTMTALLSVRPYTSQDSTTVIGIFQDAIHHIANKDYSAAQIAAWRNVDPEKWQSHILIHPIWIAEIHKIPAGWIAMEDNGHIHMLFVHSQYQHQGVANKLLQHVEKEARILNITTLFTEASLTAHPVFIHHGYHTIKKQHVTVRGETLTNFIMQKHLKPAVSSSK